MAHRPKPKYASKDPHQGPWTTCDRCGFIWSGVSMAFQYDYVGGPVPQNLGLEVCPRCYDDPAYQFKQLVLPPDPEPFRNTRPEDYMVDESGPVQQLAAAITSGTIGASFYLDLYDNDPDVGGTSVLETLTGSATRQNIASIMDLAVTGGGLANNTAITITDQAVAGAFVAWVVIFNAATAGAVIGDGPITVPQTVTMWNGCEFAIGALVDTPT